jgi:CMP/dCMP kinase
MIGLVSTIADRPQTDGLTVAQITLKATEPIRVETLFGVREGNMPLITITQSIGCGGLAVAQKVADSLNIELYDDSKLRNEAGRMTLHSRKLIREFKEEAPSWYLRLMGEPEIYLNLIESAVFEIASRGEGVIIGHGSQVLLQDFGCAMHVLISTSDDHRIGNLMRELQVSQADAKRLIRQSDNQNKDFFRYTFHRDWNDPSLYDLCINPGKMGTERAVQLVIEAAQYSEMQACGIHAREAIERLSQIKRIETYLLELDLRPLGLKVTIPKKGAMHIAGIIHNPEDRQRIEDAAKSIPGIKQVQVGVILVPDGYAS